MDAFLNTLNKSTHISTPIYLPDSLWAVSCVCSCNKTTTMLLRPAFLFAIVDSLGDYLAPDDIRIVISPSDPERWMMGSLLCLYLSSCLKGLLLYLHCDLTLRTDISFSNGTKIIRKADEALSVPFRPRQTRVRVPLEYGSIDLGCRTTVSALHAFISIHEKNPRVHGRATRKYSQY